MHRVRKGAFSTAHTNESFFARAWRIARPALSVLVSVGLLLFILSHIQWSQFLGALRPMQFWVLALAFLLLLGNDFFLAFKCYLLRYDLPLWPTLRTFLSMRFFSLLPGGNMTGEAARLVGLCQLAGTQEGTSMFIMDKQTHMIPAQVYCMIGLLFATVRVPIALVLLSVWTLLWPLLVPGLLFIPSVRDWALRVTKPLTRFRWGAPIYRQLEVLSESCVALTGHPRRLVAHLISGFIGEGCCIATSILLSWRLGFAVPWIDYLWINSIMLLAMVLPLSVMGMGVREGAMVYLLSWFGIDTSQAMTLPLIISALTLGKGILYGIIVWIDRRLHPAAPPPVT